MRRKLLAAERCSLCRAEVGHEPRHVAPLDHGMAARDRCVGQAHLALGQPAEAIASLEKYAGRFHDESIFDPSLMIGAHYLLGQAYEQSGWIDKAIEKYELFLEIWKDADPEIIMVQDAKKRLARLKSES